jgi:hypothetical protein
MDRKGGSLMPRKNRRNDSRDPSLRRTEPVRREQGQEAETRHTRATTEEAAHLMGFYLDQLIWTAETITRELEACPTDRAAQARRARLRVDAKEAARLCEREANRRSGERRRELQRLADAARAAAEK